MFKKNAYPVAATATMVGMTSPQQKTNCGCAQFVPIENKMRIVEANSPSHRNHVQKDFCASPSKGTYTWLNAPKAMYNNRKLTNVPS